MFTAGPRRARQDRYFETTAAAFVDTGATAGVADTGAWIKGTLWTVKNIFELKLGSRVRVHGNLMENCWKESQAGFAVLFTPRNQDGTSPWVYVRDVEFTGNVVRHAGSGVQIEGYDTNATSEQTRRITIANNIFDDIDSGPMGRKRPLDSDRQRAERHHRGSQHRDAHRPCDLHLRRQLRQRRCRWPTCGSRTIC